MSEMNSVTKDLLRAVSDWTGEFDGAYNIRQDGGCVGRQSSKNIRIESKKDKPDLRDREIDAFARLGER